MRQAMFQTVEKIIRSRKESVLLLADIGAMAFARLMEDIPNRAINMGIFEDGMISVAAGMVLKGMNPILYGITPFFAERSLEQIKLDFGYQNLNGTFITTGAAYDFSTLGYSHYCPGDAAIIKQIMNVQFIAPGTPMQMEKLILETYSNGSPTFFRMSDYCNKIEVDVQFGKASVIKKGKKATIIAVSTMLDIVIEACAQEDVSILYYTTLEPFDAQTLKNNCPSNRVLVCEPQYTGTLTDDIIKAMYPEPVYFENLGIPREILRTYGTKKEKDISLGLTPTCIKEKLNDLLKR